MVSAQIASCPAAFKLLVIDACHAGSEKGVNRTLGIISEDVENSSKGSIKLSHWRVVRPRRKAKFGRQAAVALQLLVSIKD